MLIDESKSFRQLASIVLKTEFSSLKMDAVEDTEHAIRLLRLASYKLIVIDVTLLNTSGCDILDHLNQRYPDIPVLVTSAMGIDHAVLKAFTLPSYSRSSISAQTGNRCGCCWLSKKRW